MFMTLLLWVGIAILILKLKKLIPRLSNLAFITETAELEFEARSLYLQSPFFPIYHPPPVVGFLSCNATFFLYTPSLNMFFVWLEGIGRIKILGMSGLG